MTECCSAILWQRLDLPGMEYCSLWSVTHGWELRGTLAVALDGQPVQVSYSVQCNERWETTAVLLSQQSGASQRELRLRVDPARRWWAGTVEIASVRGCLDVDLGLSPSTNTLPIRRLALSVGDAMEVTAAWVQFPDLSVTPLAQRYTRTEESAYRYESLASRFSADLTIDALGLVVCYAEGWERVAPL